MNNDEAVALLDEMREQHNRLFPEARYYTLEDFTAYLSGTVGSGDVSQYAPDEALVERHQRANGVLLAGGPVWRIREAETTLKSIECQMVQRFIARVRARY